MEPEALGQQLPLPELTQLNQALLLACQEAVAALQRRQAGLCLAESCTGGLVASALTTFAGVSSVFYGGVVAYSNAAKTTLLGVPGTVLQQHGAVSAPVALHMARGALRAFGLAQPARPLWALAFTGCAGPATTDPVQPVGTVFGAVACANQAYSWAECFAGNREHIRLQAALSGIRHLLVALS